MTRKSCLLSLLLLCVPTFAHALGLGDIHLNSALNQPLSADIELLGATAEELTQLRASVPSRETFARYGLDRPSFLSDLTFRVGKDASGRSILAVRSTEPATEPFVTLLVEVTWLRGRLIREFTVLLDPPVFEQQASAAPPVAAPTTGIAAGATTGSVVRTPAAEPAAPIASGPPAASPRDVPADTGPGQYRVMSMTRCR